MTSEERRVYERKRWATMTPEWKMNKWLKHKYGLSFDDFHIMYEQQEKKCALCSIEIHMNSKDKQRACVDHCHETGRVRGILCQNCNRALGMLKDNKETIKKMLEYI